MAQTNIPTNLLELYNNVKYVAESFGFKEGENGIFRNCVIKNENVRDVADNDANFWFGYIREDQPTSGAYEGFSYVIFPEHDGKRCLVSIGIGSSSIGKDGDLATNPGFRRSFMRLIKDEKARFFFKLRFDEMETSTPGLQEELYSEERKYEDTLVSTSGWKLIKAWLAQYAQWRCWDKFQKGTDKKNPTKNIKNAIDVCRVDAKCPSKDEIKGILKSHKYIVLQGAPGCGKTWTANEIAKEYGNNVVFTQFHAETTYSDFVYGIRPTLDGKTVAYKGEKGTLLEAIDIANAAGDKPVLLIIDEINRANLANVLGPVFYLFEPNADRANKLKLGTYNETGEEKVIEIEKLPDNLYVLATMNTADKSLAVVDFALRRRFAWVTLRPHKVEKEEFDIELFDKVDNLFSTYATDEELNLQPGQSYFMDRNKRKENIKYGLMPLMKEYFAEGFLLSAKEEFAQLFTSESGEHMYE